jgi:hypothetical protein
MIPVSLDSALLGWEDLRHIAFPCMSLWKRSRAGQMNQPDQWLLHGGQRILCKAQTSWTTNDKDAADIDGRPQLLNYM